MLQVSQLFIYPIKSLGGTAVQSARVTDRGLEHDRRWMLVDSNNRFLSQREQAEMALLKVKITEDGLRVSYHKTGAMLLIPFKPQTTQADEFTIWDDTCTCIYVGAFADKWFSEVLDMPCRLVYMPDDTERIVDPEAKYVQDKRLTSFSDAYPFLMIGQASLDDLNNKLEVPIPMDRFRPNIVFTGAEAFAEDTMAQFSIGNINFNGSKLCARCNVTTINQQNATTSKEPTKTLAKYRRWKNKIFFGQNLVHTGEGIINVGDEIHLTETAHMPNSLTAYNQAVSI